MEQRCQALSLVIQDGESVVEVARRFGVSRQTVHLLGLLPLQHQRKAEKTKGEFVKLRRTAISTFVSIALVTLTAVGGSSGATAAPSDNPKTLTTYTTTDSVIVVDPDGAGLDHGDIVHRKGNISLTRGGKVIGVSYTQAEVVYVYKTNATDVRKLSIQAVYPKGQVFYVGLAEVKLGELVRPGYKLEFTIVGGTGIYAGIQGTVVSTLLSDGVTTKSKSTYTLK